MELNLFQKVKVQLSLDSSNVQHEKLELKLVDPQIPGFSVSETSEEEAKEMETDDKNNIDADEANAGATPAKRSSPTPASEQSSSSKKKRKKAKWQKLK